MTNDTSPHARDDNGAKAAESGTVPRCVLVELQLPDGSTGGPAPDQTHAAMTQWLHDVLSSGDPTDMPDLPEEVTDAGPLSFVVTAVDAGDTVRRLP